MPSQSLRSQLTKVKSEVEDKSNVIYRMDCPSCEQFYIGETCRKLSTRAKEHLSDIKGISFRSAVSENVHKNHHLPPIEAQIVCNEPHLNSRRIKEALYIQANKEKLFNRDSGVELNAIWNPVIHKFHEHFKL